MRIIDAGKRDGLKLRAFVSWCGGLPAPEHSNNPLRYKFSRSPKGVLLAAGTPALYKWAGQTRQTPGPELLKREVVRQVDVGCPGFAFEGLPNRDSLKYAKVYGLDLDEMETMFRGTLRYSGFSDIMACFRDLGLMDAETAPKARTWPELLAAVSAGSFAGTTGSGILEGIRTKLGADGTRSPQVLDRFCDTVKWLGLLEDRPISEPTALDALCTVMLEKVC